VIESNRAKVLNVLAQLSEVMPELRFGQLVVNLSYVAKGPANESIWDVEDEELLAAAQGLLENRRAALGAKAIPAIENPHPTVTESPLVDEPN
jgi:hypothetical protein